MSIRSASLSLAFVAALLATGLTSPALAQSDHDRALARGLFGEGIDAFDAGDFEAAANRFRRARALFSAPSILYNLARASMQTGDLVEASEALRELLRVPEVDEATRTESEAMLAAIEPRLARLTLRVLPAEADATVFVDEREIPVAAFDAAMPLDPGNHRVRAVRDGEELHAENVTLAEGEGRVVSVAIAPRPVSSPRQAALAALAPAQPAPLEEADDTALIVGLTAGAVLVAIAAVILVGLAAGGQFDPEQPHCGNADPCILVVP